MGCIYYHKNKINGHMYIGQSICEPGTIKYGRWGVNGQGYRSNKYFWRAIKKYGWENFEHGFFEQNIPNEILNEKEIFYISKYHTYTRDPKYCGGYNLTPGGESSINTWWPEEDAWLIDNHSLNKTRDQLILEYRQAFPESYHSAAAIKARLKTLRLSDAKNVNHYTEEDKDRLIHLYLTASREEIMAAFPGRTFDSLRKIANTFIKQKHIKEYRQVEDHGRKIGTEGKKHIKLKTPDECKNIRKVNCMPDYSEAEEEILTINYPEHGPQYCQDLIKEKYNIVRSLTSIKDHATKVLKLHCHVKFIPEVGFDLEKFKEIYYNQGVQACMHEFGLTETQVRNIAGRNDFYRNSKTIEHYAKKVYCIELDKTFHGCKEAVNFIGGKTKGNISECCRGLRKSAYGYHWKYID